MSDVWDPEFLRRAPVFEPLRACGSTLTGERWPTREQLQALAAARRPGFAARSGAPLRFVSQQRRPRTLEEKYEARIYLRGEIQVRDHNWHDLFNALVWLTFPRAKSALNERHYRALLEQRAAGAANRGPVQDALTLFDEGGVIVAASDAELLRLVEAFAWKDLFWHNRERVVAAMRFYLFGHALYEKALNPFTGITGRAVLFEVGRGLLDTPISSQMEQLDAMLAARLLEPVALRSTGELAPLPILGVPGWSADNESESYYDNAEYFRAGRAGRRKT